MSILPIEIEDDKTIDAENNVRDDNITNPFATKDIKVTHATIALSSLLKRLEYGEIDLNPDFQRHANLWDRTKMSRLIESILLKLPLPVFYFDVSDPDKWIVVDGLQRLSTLEQFVVDKKLKLSNLEFLKTLNTLKYDDLDRSLKRVIDETQIITYQIEAQTPKKVRYAIFNRINTGGLSLNAQEVRQALNQEGGGVAFLGNIVEKNEFKTVVGVDSKRMYDRELVLRFIAFTLHEGDSFEFNTLGDFLDDAMEKLDKLVDKKSIENAFLEVLSFSEAILGEGHRFSRSIGIQGKTKTLNRSLFDVITVCLSEIENKEKFLLQKEVFFVTFKSLLAQEQGEFSKSITEGTSGKNAVETRFRIMRELIKGIINESTH